MATNAPSPTWIEASTGLAPGLVAALGAGAVAADQGALVGAGVAGLLALPFGVASAGAAALRRGGSPEDLVVPGVAALVAGPALSVFGALLKANTHHKALAGTTFALVALGVVAGGVALGVRARGLAAGRPWAGWVAGTLGLAVVGALALRGGGRAADAALAALAAAAGWALAPRPSRGLGAGALAGVLVATVMGVGVSREAGVAAQIQKRSVVASGLLLPLTAPAGGEVTPELAPQGVGH